MVCAVRVEVEATRRWVHIHVIMSMHGRRRAPIRNRNKTRKTDEGVLFSFFYYSAHGSSVWCDDFTMHELQLIYVLSGDSIMNARTEEMHFWLSMGGRHTLTISIAPSLHNRRFRLFDTSPSDSVCGACIRTASMHNSRGTHHPAILPHTVTWWFSFRFNAFRCKSSHAERPLSNF